MNSFRQAVTNGDIEIFRHIFEIGTDEDKEYNREWIQQYNIFDDKIINPIFWRQVRQVVKKDEENTTDKLEKGLGQS